MTKKSKTSLSRTAIVMDIGGFRPPEDPAASWIGRVNLALPGEEWPSTNGQPMLPLCQINVTELPSRPPHLEDLAFLSVFIGPKELPVNEPNGTKWCLRAYKEISALRPLAGRPEQCGIRAFPLCARVVAHDYPTLDDATELGIDIDDEDEYVEKYPNQEGFKLGGWPTLIQSALDWDSCAGLGTKTEYVFQIDSSEKVQWAWGHGGVGYFGRAHQADVTDEWSLLWQCL
jgi:uncharacterized protein YwqG